MFEADLELAWFWEGWFVTLLGQSPHQSQVRVPALLFHAQKTLFFLNSAMSHLFTLDIFFTCAFGGFLWEFKTPLEVSIWWHLSKCRGTGEHSAASQWVVIQAGHKDMCWIGHTVLHCGFCESFQQNSKQQGNFAGFRFKFFFSAYLWHTNFFCMQDPCLSVLSS
jgi:hypothetical protein